LFQHKEWIIKNVEKILEKRHFLEDGGRVLKKFKFYKNLLRRKNLTIKRQSIAGGINSIGQDE